VQSGERQLEGQVPASPRRAGPADVAASHELRSSERSLGAVSPWLIGLLFAIATASRIAAAYFLPNAEQDGYSYAEIIARLSRHFEAGQFHISDLYGFWLPLFQIVSAVLNIGVKDPIVAGKIVNAICSIITLFLVFDTTRRLTGSIWLSLGGFLIVLVNPIFLLYSAACMTDVPHACVVLASLWFALRRRWLAAAIVGALAECLRVESWALVLALPLLQWICERRVSLMALAILLIPPVGWLGINHAVTGNALSYFHDRARYHVEYILAHPERHGFQRTVVIGDAAYFLLGAGRIVSLGAVAAGVIVVARWIRSAKTPDPVLLIPLVYDASMLGLIVLAYLTKAQPVLLPRYGLGFFVVGVPLFAWALQWCLARTDGFRLKAVIVAVIVSCFLLEAKKQLPTLGKVRDDFRAHQQIASVIAPILNESPGVRCFSDDVGIRVLSKVGPERFVSSEHVPVAASANAGNFLDYLRKERVDYVIFFPTEDSLPVKLFPELSRTDRRGAGDFEQLAFARSSFGPDIWLYRLR
jgi:hypothetical protein